jgi:hypothetical protein
LPKYLCHFSPAPGRNRFHRQYLGAASSIQMRQDVKNIDQCARCEKVSKDGARELVSSLEFGLLNPIL